MTAHPRPRIIAIGNQKGGVGKTTLAMNLAAVTHALANPDIPFTDPDPTPTAAALVVSADPQGSSVWWSQRVENGGHLPFPYTAALTDDEGSAADKIRMLTRVPARHVIIDLPGNLHDADLIDAVLDTADLMLVPVTPRPLDLDPTARTIDLITSAGIPYRAVVNLYDPRDGAASLRELAEYIRRMRWHACNTRVRKYKLHERASADGLLVTQYRASTTAREARADFDRLATELGLGALPTPTTTAAAAGKAVA